MASCCNCVPYMFVPGEESKCGATAEEIKENIRIIEIHRSFVYSIGKTIYPEYDFISHDLSKFSSEELGPYSLKFIRKSDDSENPGWKTALEHHYKNNPHHPQYWGEQPMPEEFLKESIVDMIAAKYQYKSESEKLPEHLLPEMFDIQPMYLTRYIESDRKRVEEEIKRLQAIDWSTVPVRGQNFAKVAIEDK